MDIPNGSSGICYGVRRFNIPQTANIVIGVLSALVVIINSLAMISVLKNYRRLRQRIYVFVISLAATDILAGVIFLSDVMNSLFMQKQQQTDTEKTEEILYRSLEKNEPKYVKIRGENNGILSQELLETFKVGVVILSVLNTALVTFALYKRTTSMGRHHEDFKHMSASFSPDGNSFLPAFDTMMRVLSIGSPAAANGLNKNMGRHPSQMMRNEDNSSPRRISTASRFSNSSPQRSSISKEADAVLLEKNIEEPGSCKMKPQIIRGGSENIGKSKPRNIQPKKRSSSMGRLMSTGRRVSQVLRSRSTSGTQSYVGRHSYSVMSKCATGCSLCCIWIIFAATCVLPVAFRRSGNVNLGCPTTCKPVQITQLTPMTITSNDELATTDYIQHNITATPTPSFPINNFSVPANYSGADMVIKGLKKPTKKQDKNEDNILTNGDNQILQPNIIDGIGSCASPGFIAISISIHYEAQDSTIKNIGSAAIVSRLNSKNENTNSTPSSTTFTEISQCSSCSIAFYPLSKSLMVYVAVVIIVTWFWLIISASRLLHLRKHSTNVFVRCSALWRFMFMTGLMFFVTMAPYVAWIILDNVRPASVEKSPLWNTDQRSADSKNSVYGRENTDLGKTENSYYAGGNQYWIVDDDINYLHTIYGSISTCLLLINFAVAPTMYLVRLLGFRRIMSAL